MVNDNSRLRSDLEQLELELQRHLQSHKQQMMETDSTISTLLKQKTTDESAIAGFVATIQELRNEKMQSASKMTSLSKDLEDSGKELVAACSKSESMVREEEYIVSMKELICVLRCCSGRFNNPLIPPSPCRLPR